MELYWKAAAMVLLAVILSVTLDKSQRDIAVVLRIFTCCAVFAVAAQYLRSVVAYLWTLMQTAAVQSAFGPLLLKITGISLLTEMTALLSADGGNASMGKAMQLLGTSAILYLSIPFFEAFFEILQELLGIL